MGARIVTAPRHAEVCAGDHESQSNIQPPSFCWPASEQIEMSLDLLIAEEGARSAPGLGRDIERSQRFALDATGGRQRGDVDALSSRRNHSARPLVVRHGIKKRRRVLQSVAARLLQVVDGVPAPVGRAHQPAPGALTQALRWHDRGSS
jgi:hypothetical protein